MHRLVLPTLWVLVCCNEPVPSAVTPVAPPVVAAPTPAPAAPPASPPAPAPSLPAAPPASCSPRGPAVPIATGAPDVRKVSADAVAVAGDLTAVVWSEGWRARVAVIGAGGQPVAPPVDVSDPGDHDEEYALRSTGQGFQIVYHDFPARGFPDHLVARELSVSGVLGPKVVLVPSLEMGPPGGSTWLWEDGVVLAVDAALPGAGERPVIRVFHGPATGPLEQTARFTARVPARWGDVTMGDGVQAWVGRTDSGYAVGWTIWTSNDRFGSWSQPLDDQGRVAGQPVGLDLGRYDSYEWGHDGWVVTRMRSGAFEIAATPLSPSSAWASIAPPEAAEFGEIRRIGRRPWAVVQTRRECFMVGLDDALAPRGPLAPSWQRFVPERSRPGDYGDPSRCAFVPVDIDATGRGAALVPNPPAKSVLLQPLACR